MITRNLVAGALVLMGLSPLCAVLASAESRTTDPSRAPVQTIAYDMRDERATEDAHTTGTVSYMSGGVGEGGMDAIRAEEGNYNVKMLFVSQGAYLADIGVRVSDDKGRDVFETQSKGPVLLVKLPPGRYTISARSSEGELLTRRIDVGDNRLSSYILRYHSA